MAMHDKSEHEHGMMLTEMLRLQLHFVHRWMLAHPRDSFAELLLKRVDIWRKTDLNQGGLVTPVDHAAPAWKEIVAGLWHCYQQHARVEQRDVFEEQAFALLSDRVRRRTPLDFRNECERRHLQGYQCGSIRADAPEENMPDTVFFHIANAISPRSIFEDPAYVPNCLLALLDNAENVHGARYVRTATWLNSHPAWLRLFPQSWQDALREEPGGIEWHYGYWGQFINARGCFNHRLGNQFRLSGRLPYALRSSRCLISDLRLHLQSCLSVCSHD